MFLHRIKHNLWHKLFKTIKVQATSRINAIYRTSFKGNYAIQSSKQEVKSRVKLHPPVSRIIVAPIFFCVNKRLYIKHLKTLNAIKNMSIFKVNVH